MASTSSGAILRAVLGNPMSFPVANNVNLPKGSIVFTWAGNTNPLEVSGSQPGVASNLNAVQGAANFAGIVARDKIANDGVTSIPLWRSGWFECALSAVTGGTAMKAGQAVYMAYDNWVTSGAQATAKTSPSSGVAMGIALTDATAGSVLVDIRPHIIVDKTV